MQEADEYEEYDDWPPDECDHEDYEADILTGRATCNRCDHAWWQTPEEISAETERIHRYYEWVEDQERPWTRFKEWAGGWWDRLKPRWPKRAPVSDDLPF